MYFWHDIPIEERSGMVGLLFLQVNSSVAFLDQC